MCALKYSFNNTITVDIVLRLLPRKFSMAPLGSSVCVEDAMEGLFPQLAMWPQLSLMDLISILC